MWSHYLIGRKLAELEDTCKKKYFFQKIFFAVKYSFFFGKKTVSCKPFAGGDMFCKKNPGNQNRQKLFVEF